MVRESLAERFIHEGRIGRFEQFVVLAAYFDESGNHPRSKRIGVAGAVALAENWKQFEEQWRKGLVIADRERTYHANQNTPIDRVLNQMLALLVNDHGIAALCITVDEGQYIANTTAMDRSVLGNAYGFASFACVSFIADWLRSLDKGDASYYIDQGGQGYGKIMEILAMGYRDDGFRAQLKMAGFGPADHRQHLPVHTADLVAHEVITNRSASQPLAYMGERVTVHDLTVEQIRETMTQFRGLVAHFKREKQRARNLKRRGRKDKSYYQSLALKRTAQQGIRW